MNRKEDTAYLGRNLFLEGEKYLKQMKDTHPSGKVLKIEATRMLMKDIAKKKGRGTAIPEAVPDSMDDIESANTSKTNTLTFNPNQSTEISLETNAPRQDHLLHER